MIATSLSVVTHGIKLISPTGDKLNHDEPDEPMTLDPHCSKGRQSDDVECDVEYQSRSWAQVLQVNLLKSLGGRCHTDSGLAVASVLINLFTFGNVLATPHSPTPHRYTSPDGLPRITKAI